MDTDFQNNNVFEAQIRECYGRVCWSHKTHEKCADILEKRLKSLKLTQIVLSAIITTGILVAIFGENQTIGIITAILSGLLFGINSYTKDYDLGEISQKHSNAAVNLWNVREKYLSLLTDLRENIISQNEARKIRDDLQTQLASVYEGSPRTLSKAYRDATKALKENEELTFSDEEIDRLLPKVLRKIS